MSTIEVTQRLTGTRRIRDWLGDRILLIVTFCASAAAVGVMVLIAYKVIRSSHLAFSTFGISFVWDTVWDANKGVFGAAPGLYGTAVTSLIALVVATPLALAIALFLSELAPRGVRGVVGALVETLAAIPSVVLGLWGILVIGIFVAGLILAIMVVPIVASICRELFLSVPEELEEGALALGSTRWEMVRGVVLSSSRPGIAAALILGLGRAIGEGIAVTQVIGAGWFFQSSIFNTGDTLTSRI